jgi:hypothetical protein
VLFSRLGLRAIGAPLFAVWTLYFLLDAMRRTRDGKPAIARIALAGFLCGLGFYTYIAYRVTPALALLVFVYIEREHAQRDPVDSDDPHDFHPRRSRGIPRLSIARAASAAAGHSHHIGRVVSGSRL